jgi:hypothetical protein
MKSARKAGWGCLGWGITFIPFAVIFHWLSTGTGINSIVAQVVFWVLVAIIAACFLYAAWGLACGYSKGAWEKYEKRTNV